MLYNVLLSLNFVIGFEIGFDSKLWKYSSDTPLLCLLVRSLVYAIGDQIICDVHPYLQYLDFILASIYHAFYWLIIIRIWVVKYGSNPTK